MTETKFWKINEVVIPLPKKICAADMLIPHCISTKTKKMVEIMEPNFYGKENIHCTTKTEICI